MKNPRDSQFLKRALRATLPLALLMGPLPAAIAADNAPGAAAAAQQVVMPQRFSITQRGNIVVAGNTSMTCDESLSYNSQACTDARNGTTGTYGNGGVLNINDHLFMRHVDVDGDGGTFNSSSSNISLPAGSTVSFAGLYWGGNTAQGVGGAVSDASQRLTVKLKGPSGVYNTVNGLLVGEDNTTGLSRVYAGFSNVTNLVSQQGGGTYTLANVQAGTGVRDDQGESGGLFAGWGLIVVYKNVAEPLRNMSVWDRYFRVSPQTTGSALVQNLVTPLGNNPVQAAVVALTFEGDAGLAGDSLKLNATTLSNALNPSNNSFNGSVSDFGNQIGRNPSYANQLGVDVDIINADGILAHGATQAEVTLPTDGDNYFPSMIALAIEVFEPDIQMTKTARDVNGGLLNPGDLVQYTIVLTNTGPDTAIKSRIVDKIPANTTYYANSLEVVSQPGGIGSTTARTDQAGDDQAEFDSANNQVVFRVGSGANASVGGNIPTGQTVTVRFCVRISDGTPDNTIVPNTGVSQYFGSILQDSHELSATATVLVVVQTHDLSVTKTDGGISSAPGGNIVYTITARNVSTITNASNVVLTETLPDNTAFVGPGSWTRVGVTSQYTRNIGTLAPNQSQGVQFIVQVNNSIPQGVIQINNLVLVGDDGSTGPDNNPTNNQATEVTPLLFADLAITKDDGKTGLREGDTTIYTITVVNNGPGNVIGARVRDPIAHGVVTQTWTCSASTGASCSAASGAGDINTLVNLNAGSVITFLLTVVTGPCDGLLINTATVESPLPDPNPGNNSATDIDGLGDGANLMIRKTTPRKVVVAGTVLAYTIVVTNYGPDAATAVTVTDNLPSQLTYVAGSTSAGSYDNASGVWKVGALSVGASAKFVITATVGVSLPLGTLIINTVTALGAPKGNGGLVSDQYQVTVGRPVGLYLPVVRR